MLVHHLITFSMITTCAFIKYACTSSPHLCAQHCSAHSITRLGTAVLTTLDCADVFLYLCKCINYIPDSDRLTKLV